MRTGVRTPHSSAGTAPLPLPFFPSFLLLLLLLLGLGKSFLRKLLTGLFRFAQISEINAPAPPATPPALALAHPSVTPPSIAELYVIQLLVAAACVVWQNKRLRQRTRVKSR